MADRIHTIALAPWGKSDWHCEDAVGCELLAEAGFASVILHWQLTVLIQRARETDLSVIFRGKP